MRRIALLAAVVVSALMCSAVATGYTFGDWATDQGYSLGDAFPDRVSAGSSAIDSLDGVGAFDWTTTPTTTLDMHANGISSIEASDFDGLSNLKWLNLRANQVLSIEAGDFSGLTDLTWLELAYNEISSIESGSFSGLTNLTALYLGHNHALPGRRRLFESNYV